MTIDIQYKDTTSGTKVQFTFASDVVDYIVGIAYWDLQYDNSDHQTKTIAMTVDASKSGGTVTATPTATLSGEGHDLGTSKIRLCCIAVVGGTDSNVSFASIKGIANGSQSAGISVPTGSASVSFVVGWDTSYSSAHHVKEFETIAGTAFSGSQVQITATANMYDKSNHQAVNPTMNGGLIAIGPHEKQLVSAETKPTQSSKGVPVKMPVAVSPTKVAVMIKEFVVSYHGSDHDIARIWGGSPSWTVSGDGLTVTLASAMAEMHDDDPLGGHNYQDNTQSHVSMVVYGVPA